MKKYSWLLFLMVGMSVIAQKTITLNELYLAAEHHHPLHALHDVNRKVAGAQTAINNSTILPQINLSGQATWQSEVTTIPIKFPGIDIPTPPKDQYRALLEVSQSIYDGGSHRANKDQIMQTELVDDANADVQLYSFRESICRSYFGARIADLTITQLQVLINDLKQKENFLNEQIKGGVASGYQSSVLKVKVLDLDQSMQEIKRQKINAVNNLNALTGLSLDTTYHFNGNVQLSNGTRPEYKFYDAQKELVTLSLNQALTKYNPRIGAFIQGGYGKPSLNLLSDQFKAYSVIGLRAQWNLSNLYLHQSSKERDIAQNQLQKIDVQKKSFDLQQSIKMKTQELEIAHYEDLLRQDENIIQLYQTILTASNAQFENGITTVNDYTNDANNLTQAFIKRDQHRVLLNQSIELLNIIQGNK